MYIENNLDEIVIDNEFNKVLIILLDIGKWLSSNEDFMEFGCKFIKEICFVCKNNVGNFFLVFKM